MNRYIEVIARSPLGKFVVYRCETALKKRAHSFKKHADLRALLISDPNDVVIGESIYGAKMSTGQLMERRS